MISMLRYGLSLLMSYVWLASVQAQSARESYTLTEQGETYELVLVFDAGKQPVYYFRDIFTPVCLDNVCKPVRIKLFWDLLGNYLRYEVPKAEPLTKLDHKEFTPEDHSKLQEILSNENSLLKDFKMEDLVDSTSQGLSDSVDAITGATKNTVKGEVIEGALYTCYTLWHLAHGTTPGEILKITQSKLNDALLHHFLRSDNYHYVYFALGEVMDTEGLVRAGFLTDVLTLLESDNVFAARRVWERINLSYFATDKMQEQLWRVFDRSPYMQQVAMLKKISELSLDSAVVLQIVDYLPQLNQALFKQALSVLASQETLSKAAQEKLMAYLTAPDKERARAVYEVMKQHKQIRENFNEQLRTYKP
ncbi:hypothetical protein QT327_01600 [Olivibacter sp. 47]|uniref:hypothetical protein n=1 Tax=Olivibacter sp. 47 TaxID=3056486 RepID=UPI0025A35049|nr:hypothetical protein [Olivibacter sp. 47]MDM8173053.1 hypothetical protein [Olivibacter sp. 47]